MKKVIFAALLGVIVVVIFLCKEDTELPKPAPSAVAPADTVTVSKDKPEASADAKPAAAQTQAERLELVRQRAQEAKRLDQERRDARLTQGASGASGAPHGLPNNVIVNHPNANVDGAPKFSPPPQWFSTNAAADDSVEGQLRSVGNKWTKVDGVITEGVYVQDKLEGRLSQPEGRGAIGKVLQVKTDENGRKLAIVDFGRGFSPGIFFEELTPVNIVR